MYECEIIELEEYNFNHLVHHYDLDTQTMIEYALEHKSMGVHPEYYGELYWDEH